MSSVADHSVHPPNNQSRTTKVPIQNTELSVFDDTFSFLKEKFAIEMKKMETEMNKFNTDLMALYNTQPTLPPKDTAAWQNIYNSPLVQGKGNDKTIKVQFDVSQFDPAEVEVQVIDDSLYVCAAHEEKADDRTIYREFKREFLLPRGTNPELVISSISRDGILTVQAPLPNWTDSDPVKISDSKASLKTTHVTKVIAVDNT